jgi:hypothetical protein
MRGSDDGLHPRSAQSVDSVARSLDGEPGEEGSHPGDVPVVFAGLVGRAPLDVFDGYRIKIAVSLEQTRDGVGSQVIRPDMGKLAASLPHRGAAPVDYVDICHSFFLQMVAVRAESPIARRLS